MDLHESHARVTDVDLMNTMGPLWERSDLMCLFFSRANFEALHGGLRYLVHKRTGLVVGRQSDVEMQRLMREVFEGNATGTYNGQAQVLEEVRRMNGIILDAAVRQVSDAIELHRQNVRRFETLPIPIDYAQSSRD